MSSIKKVTNAVMDTINDRMDGFVSSLTGLGSKSDKARSYIIKKAPDLQDEELEELYDGNGLAAKIVDKYVEEMFREGFEVTVDIDDDAKGLEMGREVRKALYDNGFVDAFRQAIWGARFAGGAVVWPQVNDGSDDLSEELNKDKILGFEGIRTVDARYVEIEKVYDDPDEARFGKVSHYRLRDDNYNKRGKNAPLLPDVVIHESRLIVFQGYKSVSRMKMHRPGWGKSVLERVLEDLEDYSSSWMSVAHMMQDSAQTVAYIKGLFGFMSSKSGQDTLLKRMSLTNIQRSVSRMIMMDADERFERQQHNMNGLEKIVREFGVRLSGVVGMPMIVLFGVSEGGGMGESAQEHLELFYNSIGSEQESKLSPPLIFAIEILLRAGIIKVDGDATYDVMFNSLSKTTDTEKSDIRLKHSQASQIDIMNGILLPEEAALSTYRAGGFSSDIQIDHGVRQKALKEALKDMETRALEPPEEDDDGDDTNPNPKETPED